MYWWFFLFFFFKQKTAYEMRISDWSSDVCSSDLHAGRRGGHLLDADAEHEAGLLRGNGIQALVDRGRAGGAGVFHAGRRLEAQARIGLQIGRASCRERVCQYV